MMLDVAAAIATGQSHRPYHVPVEVPRLLVDRTALGISGSRAPDEVSLRALADLAERWGRSRAVLVGDQRGIDAAAVRAWPRAGVFNRTGEKPADLIARSIRMLDALGQQERPLLAAFPAKACPTRIVPGEHWVSGADSATGEKGSGTWSTAALAVGRGLPLLLWLPSPLWPPASWAPRYLGGGWWARRQPTDDRA
jgi:hypothetical protein